MVSVTWGIRSEDLNPDDVTEHLGITPTWSFKKGDPFGLSAKQQARAWGVWQISTEDMLKSENIEEHLSLLIGLLMPRKELLTQYVDSDAYVVDTRIWYESTGDVSSFAIQASVVGDFASISNDFNFSIIANQEED